MNLNSISAMNVSDRRDVRSKAEAWLSSGDPAKIAMATPVLAELDRVEDAEAADIYQRMSALPDARRVVAAFKAMPMTENERKTIQALLDNPGSTSTELSRACGHNNMIWQMHFGNLCKDRQAYLWPAVKSEKRDEPVFSGILAEIGSDNRFTMKPDVVEAVAELGLRPRRSSTV